MFEPGASRSACQPSYPAATRAGDLPRWVLAAARDHAHEPRLHVYSGHDSTVTAAVRIFHLEPQGTQATEARGIADYGAHLIVEVHRDVRGTLALQVHNFFKKRIFFF